MRERKKSEFYDSEKKVFVLSKNEQEGYDNCKKEITQNYYARERARCAIFILKNNKPKPEWDAYNESEEDYETHLQSVEIWEWKQNNSKEEVRNLLGEKIKERRELLRNERRLEKEKACLLEKLSARRDAAYVEAKVAEKKQEWLGAHKELEDIGGLKWAGREALSRLWEEAINSAEKEGRCWKNLDKKYERHAPRGWPIYNKKGTHIIAYCDGMGGQIRDPLMAAAVDHILQKRK